MTHLLLAVDQGTTGSTVLVVRPDGGILGRGYEEHPQHFPQPGWVEHDPLAIWATVQRATEQALAAAGVSAASIGAVGITNQRETIVAWDASTSQPLGPTIVWQDRRTEARCEALRSAGNTQRIRHITGLPVDPYFSASKIEWLMHHDQQVQRAAHDGTLRVGTIDTWLVWCMTGGASHITDASNAARTMLYDIHAEQWSAEQCELFGVDRSWLPDVVDSSGMLATCNPRAFCSIDAPICGIAGDQQSALFGQLCITPGRAKATYGTGAFVLVNSGSTVPTTEALISTVAWQRGGATTYALEGSVFTAGASVQWLRDGLQIIEHAPEIEALATSVPDSGGVMVVPAFAGLGAPHWDANARGAMFGLTRGTTRAHIARATIEGTAFRVAELIDAMRAEGTSVTELRVDGGMAHNNLLLQMQADVLGIPVTRPTSVETTSLGAAYLAALGSGMIGSMEDLSMAWTAERTFEPGAGATTLSTAYHRFQEAVRLTRALALAGNSQEILLS